MQIGEPQLLGDWFLAATTTSAFAAIADELHNLYMLGYYPASTRRDNKLHKIKVEVARKDVQIRARSGYQTPKADNKK